MIQKNIYSIAVAAFAFIGGAIAPSAAVQTATPKSLQLSTYSYQLAQSTTTITIAALEDSVHQQINQLRRSQGLPALTRNSAMNNQARIHSQNMANKIVPFGHIGFAQRIQATGISYRAAAENVAYNWGYSDPATQAVQGWRYSSGHWRNIIGNYNLTGIGVARNSRGEVYFTQLFIRTP
jgi:uncharacterized protein YkwD